MYREIKVNYSYDDISAARKKLKDDGFVSSVAISQMIARGEIKIPFTRNTFFTKARKLIQNSDEFTAIKFNVAGTIKWYYPKKDIDRIVNGVTS